MPNGYDYSEQRHGPHDYGDGPADHTCDCRFGCGCSMGPFSSHGPTGVDPFGECPGNPIEGRGFNNLVANTDFVVTRRIKNLESRMHKAEEIVKRTRPAKKDLAAKLEESQREVTRLRNKLLQIQRDAVYE